ncbi:RimK family alpha-L-glutamate ligase [Streptomyces californicus]|uniref:RimK family alpha-L-glutamate ligase n=1 Tax=Streptomyces californicus TaxID=67351 RepID=UPI00379BBA7C
MAQSAVRLALVASRIRSDEKLLLTAAEKQAVPVTVVDSRTLTCALDAVRPEWNLALNREIGYARALYAARGIEAAHGTVVNSARATELCGDKWQTSVALARSGVATPRTVLALTPEAALDALSEVGYPAVLKPLVGSWGRLVTPVADEATARLVLEYVSALPHPTSHIVYAQAMVDKRGRDLRVAVVGGRAIAAAHRSSPEWRTNVHLGATTQVCALTPELDRMAVDAAAAVGAEIAGVDIVEDTDGRPFVLEVNHGFEFTGLQQSLGRTLDVAGEIVAYLAGRPEMLMAVDARGAVA